MRKRAIDYGYADHFRRVYQILAVTKYGDLLQRRYARNRRTAEKIYRELCKRYGDDIVEISECGAAWKSHIVSGAVEG